MSDQKPQHASFPPVPVSQRDSNEGKRLLASFPQRCSAPYRILPIPSGTLLSCQTDGPSLQLTSAAHYIQTDHPTYLNMWNALQKKSKHAKMFYHINRGGQPPKDTMGHSRLVCLQRDFLFVSYLSVTAFASTLLGPPFSCVCWWVCILYIKPSLSLQHQRGNRTHGP